MKYALLVGEMLIDFIPRPGEVGDTPTYQPHPGGSVANVAVALARLGGHARFIGKVSEDSFGRLLLRVLQENQVDTRFVPLTSQGNTTLALVTLQADGQREFTFYRQGTADTLLARDDLPMSAWEEVAFCQASSLLLTNEPARSAMLFALEQARRLGRTTSFDVNARLPLWTSERQFRAELAQIVERVDLLKCSAEEAHYLDDTLTEPFALTDVIGLQTFGAKLLSQGPALLIITRGPLGALLMNRHACVTVPARTIQALDTTGAGDAFMGAVLYQLLIRQQTTATQLSSLDAETLRALGTFANSAAGLSSTRYGGIASLPWLNEVEQLENA